MSENSDHKCCTEPFTAKCCIKRNSNFGRYVEALEDIFPGEIIYTEKPIAIFPGWDSTIRCSNCFRKSADNVCNKCNFFPLCLNCKTHHYSDCDFFEKLQNISKSFLIENYATFGPLKCLLLMENIHTEESWKKLLEMESHINERRNTDIWKECDTKVVKPILESGIAKYFQKCIVDEELLQQICGIIDVNSFEIRGPDIETTLRAIYRSAALLAHDCVANTFISIDSGRTMKIYASLPIERGQNVYYNYTNPLWGTAQRKIHLKEGKYFDCLCKRCEDPTELGSYMSSLTCLECKGLFLFNTTELKWTCNKCSKIMANEVVDKILTNINEEILIAQDDLRQMELLIAKYTPILNPNHYIIIDLKQNVASILRAICLNSTAKPGKGVLERKIQLCREIMPVLQIIQPGLSRLKAIALYEYFTPLIELAKRNYEDSTISIEDYLSQLRKGENTLKEALQMLLYEPSDTPEGNLAKRAFQEMKEVRIKIDEISAKIDKQRSI